MVNIIGWLVFPYQDPFLQPLVQEVVRPGVHIVGLGIVIRFLSLDDPGHIIRAEIMILILQSVAHTIIRLTDDMIDRVDQLLVVADRSKWFDCCHTGFSYPFNASITFWAAISPTRALASFVPAPTWGEPMT